MLVEMVERKRALYQSKGLLAATTETAKEGRQLAGCAMCFVSSAEMAHRHLITPCVAMNAW